VSGLAHLFEREGFSTVEISLYHPHMRGVGPPRALEVPFQLGRPLGVPNDPAFQRRVLEAALKLLDAAEGPVVAAFPDDVPGADPEGWSPSLGLDAPYDGAQGPEAFGPALEAEMAKVQPYYDKAVKSRGRTTVGASGYSLDDAREFLVAFLCGRETPKPPRGLNQAMALKLVCEDLSAFYTEAAAITAERPSTGDMVPWFWCDTTLGQAILGVNAICEKSANANLKELTEGLMLPIFWNFQEKAA
jgi:hypothetical protein